MTPTFNMYTQNDKTNQNQAFMACRHGLYDGLYRTGFEFEPVVMPKFFLNIKIHKFAKVGPNFVQT